MPWDKPGVLRAVGSEVADQTDFVKMRLGTDSTARQFPAMNPNKSHLLLPVIVAVIVVLLLVQWRKGPTTQSTPTSNAHPPAAADGMLIEDALLSAFSEAGVRFAKINNDAKTEADELPRLEEINAKLIFIKQSFDSLPEPGKARVRAVATRRFNDFSSLANQVATSPTSSAAFKSITEQLLTKLKAFAQ